MKLKIALVVALLVAGIGFMVISSSGAAAHPHYQLTELRDLLDKNPQKYSGRFMTVYGNVKEGSVKKSGIQANFVIEQAGEEMPVFFTGKTLLPDTFKDGAEASLDGVYDREKQMFIADKALAKCGSKYKSDMKYTSSNPEDRI